MVRILLALICCLFSLSSQLWAQQCFDSKTFYPIPGTTPFRSFGSSLDTFEDILVVGANNDHSLAAWAGMAHVYQLGATKKWSKIADLKPSTSLKFMDFGRETAIHGNTIAITGRIFNDAGVSTEQIYIYEKPVSGWTSAVESSVLSMSGMFIQSIELHQDQLIAIVTFNGKSHIRVFTKTAGIFTLTQIIESPPDVKSQPTDISRIIVTDDMIVAGVPYYQSNINAQIYGVVLIYNKNGSTYSATPDAVLKPSSAPGIDYMTFGETIAMNNSTIVVGAGFDPGQSPSYGVYVFEKPSTGWTSATESAMVPITTPYFSPYSAQLAITDNYIFLCGQQAFESRIQVFKKTMFDWSSGVEKHTISNPFPGGQFGWQLSMVGDDHLVVGSPNSPYIGTSGDMVMDYYFPQHDWENIAYPQQIIQETAVNAGYNWFGNDLAATENHLIVGAPGDFAKGYEAGAAYVFDVANPNAAPQKIYSPRPQNISSFGHAVAAGDSLLFVSAVYEDTVFTSTSKWYDIGKVFVYRLGANGWEFRSQIVAPTIREFAFFGQEIAYHKGYVAITQFYTNSSEDDGRVHIYKQEGTDHFDYIATLQPSDDTRGDFFGRTLTMNDSLLIVGSGNQEYSIDYARKTYIYKKKGEWKDAIEDARLISSDKVLGDYFGRSVAVSGDYIIVGAPGYPHSSITGYPNRSGAAYVFKRPSSGWKGDHYEIAKLEPTDPSGEALFGYSVAMTANDIYIGSPKGILWWNVVDHVTNDDNHLKPGKVYHFTRHGTEWTSSGSEDDVIESDNPNWLDGFGSAMLMHNGTLSIAASIDNNHTGYMAGSVKTMTIAPTMEPMCGDSNPVVLPTLLNTTGTWTGTGVNGAGNIFDPAIAGPGVHELTYTSTTNNCHATMQVLVLAAVTFPVTSIGPLCNTGVAFDLSTIAQGGTWSGKGVASGRFDPKLLEPGIYTLTYQSIAGCTNTLSAEVVEGRINVISSSGSQQKKCPGKEVTLVYDTDATVDRYRWLYRANQAQNYTVVATNTKTITSSAVGFYKVEIVTQICAGTTAEFTVNDFALPDISIPATPVICKANAIVLTATPVGGTWKGSGITSAGELKPATMDNGLYKYVYTLITSNGCPIKDSTNVLVDKFGATPTIIASNPVVCFDTPAKLSLDISYPGATVSWYQRGFTNALTLGERVDVTRAETYYARISRHGCILETDPITLEPVSDSLNVPNVFTPNGDSFNDYFEVQSNGLSHFNVQILNRYGKEIFHSETPQFKWPGSGTSGTYFWKMTYQDCSGENKQHKGWVQVLE